MEGTLWLLDWRPEQAAPPEPVPCSVETDLGPRIVVFDCETTGTDRAVDQIIELCIQRGLDSNDTSTWRIKPAAPIHPGAQAVHGITTEDLAECPTFAELADAIEREFANADVIVGYNIAFDIEMLQAEYQRIGRAALDLANKQIVDAFRLWQQCEPRSLQHAHQRFVGNPFESAHSASADVAATARVLVGMLEHFKLAHQDWSQIASVCDPGRATWAGPTRHLRWDGDALVFNFGKHAGLPVHAIAAGPDRSFLSWVLDRPQGRDFPQHVCDVARAALDRTADDFLVWAHERFAK